MPNAAGQILLDADGRRTLDAAGKLSCRCCCDPCPPGLASSYLVSFHATAFPGEYGDTDADYAVTVTNTPEDPCTWTGSFTTADSVVIPFNLARVQPPTVLLDVTCGWTLTMTVESSIAGDDPAGPYPDGVDAGPSFTFTNIVVS